MDALRQPRGPRARVRRAPCTRPWLQGKLNTGSTASPAGAELYSPRSDLSALLTEVIVSQTDDPPGVRDTGEDAHGLPPSSASSPASCGSSPKKAGHRHHTTQFSLSLCKRQRRYHTGNEKELLASLFPHEYIIT